MDGIACVGECMLELTSLPNGDLRMGFGGDTLNTAVYMARLGAHTSFVSAIGNDAYSNSMLAQWQDEGIATADVTIDTEHNAGLYAIQTDDSGERSFTYWRSDSAAKHLFQSSTEYFQCFSRFNMVYFSGITLSLLSDATFTSLMKTLPALRTKGLQVVFDLNYRPRNWASVSAAKSRISTFLQEVDIALPSFDDEQLLFGDKSPTECLDRYRAAGVSEVVLKNGEDGCYVYSQYRKPHQDNTESASPAVHSDAETHFPVTQLIQPIDTTAAGDSFNAGYLAQRLKKESIENAVCAAQRCAALVIQHRGAIVDKQVFKEANI